MSTAPDNGPFIEIAAADFDAEVLKSAVPVLLVIQAPWSHPCLDLEATLAEVAAKAAGKARLLKLNADENPSLCLYYDVCSIPTLMYFVAGHLRAKVVGTATKDSILAQLEALTL